MADPKDKTDPYMDWVYEIDESNIDHNIDRIFREACEKLEKVALKPGHFNFAETPDQLEARDPEAYKVAKEELAQSSRLAKGPKNE